MILKNNKYYEYFLLGLKNFKEYKFEFFITTFYPIIKIIILIKIWQYIFIEKGTKLIGGFTYKEMIIYILITQMILLKDFGLSYDISDIIKNGDIVIYLTKPINFVKSILFKDLGNNIIPFVSSLFVFFSIIFFFNFNLPDFYIFLIFIVYGIFLWLFFILLEIFIGGVSFWTVESWGIKNVFDMITMLLSGNLLPLSLFPNWSVMILKWTPFFYLDYTFATILLGRYTILYILKALLILIFWNMLLLLFVILIFKKGFKNLVTYGG